MAAIEFDKTTLGEIVKTKEGLSVPVNQRAYAWEKDHVQDFLRDITVAMQEPAEEYFVGSIIVIKQGGRTEIYDGQQRLATTMMLVAAIRDYIYTKGSKEAAREITRESLEKMDPETEAVAPKLKLSADDAVFFENYVLHLPDDPGRRSIQPDPRKESHTKIVDAKKLAAKHVADLVKPLPPTDGFKLLHKLNKYLVSSVRAIWVQVGDQGTAFRIFETMNDRGLKLSAADLIKNYLCSLAPDDTDAVIQKWKGMTANLETLGQDNGDIVEFIRYFWIVNHGHVRTADLFGRIKVNVHTKTAALNWMSSLDESAGRYVAILNSSHEVWGAFDPSVRRNITTLWSILGVSAIRPLMMATYEKFSKVEQTKVWKLAVNWSVRFLISGVQSGTLEGHYNRNAKAITDGVIKNSVDLTKEMAKIIPPDDKFKASFSRANVSSAVHARYYLRTLELQKSGLLEPSQIPNEDQTVVTLEHILPQNPGQGWDYIPAEMQRPLCYRLGNQCLLTSTANNGVGNASYEDKKPMLVNSDFKLTQIASEFQIWDVIAIDSRQDELAKLAVKAWPLRIR